MHRSRWDGLGSRMDVQVAACFELTLCCQASKACKGSTEAFGPRHTTGLYSWLRGRQPTRRPHRPKNDLAIACVLVQRPHHISRPVLPRVGPSALVRAAVRAVASGHQYRAAARCFGGMESAVRSARVESATIVRAPKHRPCQIEVLIDLLGSDPEDLHGAHSGAPGNRRNIGSRNKRLLRTSRACSAPRVRRLIGESESRRATNEKVSV